MEYKTICDSCGIKTYYETEQPCKNTIFQHCPTCGSGEFISKPMVCKGTLRIIDKSNLDKRFDSYYENGQRVEVTEPSGEKHRFWVGKSTGWKPYYLEILKSNSSGGAVVYASEKATIRGLGIYR